MSGPPGGKVSRKDVEDLVSTYVKGWMSSNIVVPRGAAGALNPGRNVIHAVGPLERQSLVFTRFDDATGRWVPRYRIEEMDRQLVHELPALLLPQFRVQPNTYDHKVLWSWTIELVVMPDTRGWFQDQALQESLELLFRLMLAPRPPSDSTHIRTIISQKELIAFVLAFPFLEGLLKYRSSAFVYSDGRVKQPFQLNGGPRGGATYDPAGRGTINNLEHLLYLFEEQVATTSMKQLLTEYRSATEALTGNPDCYGMLYQWRNDTLHGAAPPGIGSGILLNLICLLILDIVPDASYQTQVGQSIAEDRAAVTRMAKMSSRGAPIAIDRFPLDFYPPDPPP
jgi:hypothetical protein